MKKSKNPKLSVFDTFKTKTKQLTGEAKRQRAIIALLATKTNATEKTRTAISQSIANEEGIVWKNIYSGIFRDLDEILIPLNLVEEAGRLPLKRGPKALQEKGIPHYQLTRKGLMVALSLGEIKYRDKILQRYAENSREEEKEILNVIQNLFRFAPRFAGSLIESYIKAYCHGELKEILPVTFESFRKIADEGIKIQQELLEAFQNFSTQEKKTTLTFLKNIS